MAEADRSGYHETWLESATRATRIHRLGRRVTGSPERESPDRTDVKIGAYVLVTVLVLVFGLVLPLLGYLQTGSFLPLAEHNYLILLPAWLLVVWSLFRLRHLYAETVDKLPGPADFDDRGDIAAPSGLSHAVLTRVVPGGSPSDCSFSPLFPRAGTGALLLAGVSYHFAWMLTDPTAGGLVRAHTGELIMRVKMYVIVPFVFYPLGVELLATFLGIAFLLPLRIRRTRRVDFQDPTGHGGLKPVGDLSRTASLHYLLVLSAFVAWVALGRGQSVLDPAQLLFVVVGTVFGLVLFLWPVVQVGSHMQRMKTKKLETIHATTAKIGEDNLSFPEARSTSIEEITQYVQEYARMATIRDMHEYPVDIAAVQSVVLTLPVPLLVNLFTTYLTSRVIVF